MYLVHLNFPGIYQRYQSLLDYLKYEHKIIFSKFDPANSFAWEGLDNLLDEKSI